MQGDTLAAKQQVTIKLCKWHTQPSCYIPAIALASGVHDNNSHCTETKRYNGLLGRAEASPTLVMSIEIFSICIIIIIIIYIYICAVRLSVYISVLNLRVSKLFFKQHHAPYRMRAA